MSPSLSNIDEDDATTMVGGVGGLVSTWGTVLVTTKQPNWPLSSNLESSWNTDDADNHHNIKFKDKTMRSKNVDTIDQRVMITLARADNQLVTGVGWVDVCRVAKCHIFYTDQIYQTKKSA